MNKTRRFKAKRRRAALRISEDDRVRVSFYRSRCSLQTYTPREIQELWASHMRHMKEAQ